MDEATDEMRVDDEKLEVISGTTVFVNQCGDIVIKQENCNPFLSDVEFIFVDPLVADRLIAAIKSAKEMAIEYLSGS